MIWNFLNESLAAAFAAAGYGDVPATVEVSRRPDVGQFQCTAAMSLARSARQSPAAIARAVVASLPSYPFERVSVDGPGFINFSLSDRFLAGEAAEALDDPRHGCPTVEPHRLMIDFGGPNVAKRMHVGHLRSSVIGDALQRCCRFIGHDVVSDVHLGDWGLPMGMLIAEIRRRWPALPYFGEAREAAPAEGPEITVELLNRLYPEAAQRCGADAAAQEEAKQATAALQSGHAGYRALWRRMVEVSVDAVKADLDLLDIRFDLWEGESDVRDVLPEMVRTLRESGVAHLSSGALVVPVEREDDAEPVPPLILVKGDGSATYGATDLTTIEYRVQRYGPRALWYVVDQRQRLHFVQVFRAAEKAGFVPDDVPALEHLGFGTVNGPDGKPFKTRAGEVMTLRMLLDQTIAEAAKRLDQIHLSADVGEAEREVIATRIGLAAIKFADLRNFRQSDYVFDISQFLSFEGKTGPYLCYSVVRARSLLAKAAAAGLAEGTLAPAATPEERGIHLRLLDFGRAVLAAYERRAPNVLCDHAYELAQAFNAFYHASHVLTETDPERRGSWLRLTRGVAEQLQLTLSLLGIAVPDRM